MNKMYSVAPMSQTQRLKNVLLVNCRNLLQLQAYIIVLMLYIVRTIVSPHSTNHNGDKVPSVVLKKFSQTAQMFLDQIIFS